MGPGVELCWRGSWAADNLQKTTSDKQTHVKRVLGNLTRLRLENVRELGRGGVEAGHVGHLGAAGRGGFKCIYLACCLESRQ